MSVYVARAGSTGDSRGVILALIANKPSIRDNVIAPPYIVDTTLGAQE